MGRHPRVVYNDSKEVTTLQENQPVQIAHQAVQLASDHQAVALVLLDVRGLCSFADFFVLMTAETRRHTSALAQELDHGLVQLGVRLRHQEGSAESGWILLDFGDLIVHIFGPEERAYYDLERLWAQALPLVRVQ